MTTINDIAKHTGLSKSTVSRVLSKTGYVKEETRQKIYKAMEDLNYTPNYIARGMRTNKSSTIGLFIPDLSNPFYPELFKGIEQVTRKAGYINLVCHTTEDPKAEMFYINELLKRQIDGIIMCTYHSDPANLEYLKELSMMKPIVFMDPVFDNEGFSYVVCDGFLGIKKAVNYLVEKRCERIAYIKGPNIDAVTSGRYQGYLEGIKEAGFKVNRKYIFESDYTINSGREAVRYFLNLPDRPDAIVSTTDLMAIGALKELKRNSVKVPEEIKVVGFDNIPMAELIQPSLTTIAQPIRELGINAAELLLKKIENPETSNQQIVMQCTLIERESSR